MVARIEKIINLNSTPTASHRSDGEFLWRTVVRRVHLMRLTVLMVRRSF